MITKKVQKVLSGIILATYMIFSTAQMGLCLSSVPIVKTGVEKPALRDPNLSSSVRLDNQIVLSKKNPKISLSLRDSDVQQVLRMLADKAGLNIIFHNSVTSGTASTDTSNLNPNQPNNPNQPPQVQPPQNQQPQAEGTQDDEIEVASKITLDLVNVPLNDAFRMITQVAGLSYYLDNTTIVVVAASTAKKLNLSKQELMIIPVKYVNAGAMAEFLNKNIFQKNKPGITNSQVASTNPSKNEILIFGTKNDYLLAKNVVSQLDTKPLEESFIVNHTTPKEMATLICSALFNYKKPDDKDSSSSSTSSSSTSSESSESSSSSNTSSTTSTSEVVLGQGIVACRDSKKINISKDEEDSKDSKNDSEDSKNNDIYSLNDNGLSIVYYSQKGTVSVIGGSIQQIEMVKDFIAKNDKKLSQAYLEVSIIELNESGSKEFDNTWNVYSGFFSGSFNGENTSTNSLYPTIMSGYNEPILPVNRYIGPSTITYTMNYIISNNKGRILANPKIIITNGKESVIDLTSDYVQKVDTTVVNTTAGSTTTTQYTIGNDEGIHVKITPYISNEGYVTLNVSPNYITQKQPIKEYDPNAKKDVLRATLMQRRDLALQNIRIKDGETFVIGGMMVETEDKEVSKIPALGDLPGLGMFFRNTNYTKKKQELVIMLTPKIIKDNEDIVTNSNMTL